MIKKRAQNVKKKVEERRLDTKKGNRELKAYPSGLIYRRHAMSTSHTIHLFRCEYRWSMEHAHITHVCRIADISILYLAYTLPRKSIGIEYVPHSYEIRTPKHEGTPRQIHPRRAFLMCTTIRPVCFNFITPTGSCDVNPALIPRAEY